MNLTRLWMSFLAISVVGGALTLTCCGLPGGQGQPSVRAPEPSGRATPVTTSQGARLAAAPRVGMATPSGGTECSDGIDNDGDGSTDWHYDPGCYGSGDRTEASGPRASENGFSTWDFGPGSVIVYVAAGGSDTNDGLSPHAPVRTLRRASELVRDGQHDFIRLRRGDTWRDEGLGRFKSGRDAGHPLVVGAYGDSPDLPRIEVRDSFINHDGAKLSFVALVDLHLIPYRKDPLDPDFDGTGSGLIRYVGNGSHLLIEGCHLEYGEIVLQSYGGRYEDVEIRANVIEKSYHAGTCVPGDPRGNHDYRPSGIYSSHVERLTIEGNLFDHNGWNEDVESACATIYNHNIYVNANQLRIIDNLFARASSIHVKLRSDQTGEMSGVTIDNNYFVEGEVGISAGGNTKEPFRFEKVTISRNVLSDVGRTRPTTRTLAWAVDSSDTADLAFVDNLILNQRQSGVDNSYGFLLTGTQRNANIQQNLFYRIQGRAIVVKPTGPQSSVSIVDNTIVDPDQRAVLVDHDGPLAGYRYAKGHYFGSASPAGWFRLAGADASLDQWQRAAGEADAQVLAKPTFSDPGRTIESYAATLGLDPSLDSFLERARTQTRSGWSSELTASAINDYLRRGFDR